MPGARCSADGRGAQRADATGSEPTLPARHGQNDPEAALGRKNWLFAGAEAGGETLADALTLIETAKLAGQNPEAYLADVLARINDHLITRLDELLPWHWQPAAPDAAQAA